MTSRNTPAARFALVAASLVLALALVPAAFGGKGGGANSNGGKKGGGGGTTYTGSFVGANPLMVVDANGDGLPDFGDQITFDVSSNATYYFVELDCSQNGVIVSQQTNGFYLGWAWSKTYKLSSMAWTGGAASCTAVLYASKSDGSGRQNLAAETFSVGA